MNKRILLSVLFITLACCLVVSLLAVASVLIYRRYSISPQVQAVPTQEGMLPTSAPVTAPTATALAPTRQPAGTAVAATPAPTMAPVPYEVAAQMDTIQQQVSLIRGLQALAPVQRGLMTPDQLRERMRQDIYEQNSPQDIEDNSHMFAILGLLPEGFDLQGLYLNLLSEQVAGFYDAETKEMYVVQGEAFKGPEKMTYAHEFTHTLQDQNYDLRNGLKDNPEYCRDHSEYCLAVDSLVEGDASLVESLWLYRSATRQDQKEITDFYNSYSSPVYDSTPYFMQQDLMFPYQYGLEFVQTLYDQGRFGAVDAAYRNPPVSSEQILHPERYPNDVPLDVTLPDLLTALGSGWREVDRNVMGEWSTYLILSAGYQESTRLDADTAAVATKGWGGDAYSVLRNDEQNQTLFVMQSRWDTPADLDEFFNALEKYGNLRWGNPVSSTATEMTWSGTPDGTVLVYKTATDVVWMITPDAAAAQVVRTALGE